MFLQRLINDETCGFNYDFMGYAEYEHGATTKSRTMLAQLMIDRQLSSRKVRFFERFGLSRSGPVDVYVFASNTTLTNLGIANTTPDNKPYDLLIGVDKTSARLDNSKILGWMSVHMEGPILILRDIPGNLERGNKFLQPAMDYILREE